MTCSFSSSSYINSFQKIKKTIKVTTLSDRLSRSVACGICIFAVDGKHSSVLYFLSVHRQHAACQVLGQHSAEMPAQRLLLRNTGLTEYRVPSFCEKASLEPQGVKLGALRYPGLDLRTEKKGHLGKD